MASGVRQEACADRDATRRRQPRSRAPSPAAAALQVGVALAVALALLAGCTQAPPPPPALPTLELHAGGYYLVHHPGGPLRLESEQDAALEVRGPDDLPLGTLTSRNGAPGGIPDLPAGDLVLHAKSLNGTVRLRTGSTAVAQGQAVALSPHVERVVLVTGQALLMGTPLAQGSVAGASWVNLTRPPVALRILAAGGYEGLSVDVQSGDELVLEAGGDGGDAMQGGPLAGHFTEVAGHADLARLEGPDLFVSYSARALEGTLVLEATGYSRIVAPSGGDPRPLPGPPAFAYGDLALGPTAFEAVAGAHLQFAAYEPAWVSLHLPDDRRLGTYRITPPGLQVTVPQDGTYVAVVHEGGVSLGSDRAPGDLALRRLDTRWEASPVFTFPSPGYTQQSFTTSGGVPFEVRVSRESFLTPFDGSPMCGDDGLLQVEQDGQAVGVVLSHPVPEQVWTNATARLDGTPLTTVMDGFGDACSHSAVEVLSYVREA